LRESADARRPERGGRLGTVVARGAIACALLAVVAVNPLTLRPLASADGLSAASVRLIILFDAALLALAALMIVVPRSRRPLLRLGLAIGVPVVAAELVLRVFDPLGTSYYFDATRMGSRTVPDPDFAYILRAGDSFALSGVPFDINSDGLRGPEIETPKPLGRRRVLLLGDSVVMGAGVRVEQTFAAGLRSRLHERGFDADVVAAGVSSWNTRTEREWLRARGWALAPDVVVLVPVPNDVEPKAEGRIEIPRDQVAALLPQPIGTLQVAAGRSYLLTSVLHVVRKRAAAARTDALYDEGAPAWHDARLALAGIVADCREHGVKLLVFPYAPARPESAFRHAWARALSEEGVASGELPEEVFAARHHVSLIDPHPDAGAHDLIARAMLPAIVGALDRVVASGSPAP
jgi:hypothetical protein